MPSPVLNEKTFRTARADSQAGWAAPEADSHYYPPITDGPVSAYAGVNDRMTLKGTMTATGVLFTLLLAAGAFGWASVKPIARAVGQQSQKYSFPSWIWAPLIGALVACLVTAFKPTVARYSAPVYAVLEGLVVGAISRAYDVVYHGIAIAAAGATVAVFAVMLFLYTTRVIKVTDRLRRTVMAATMGVVLLYGVSMLINLFGGRVSFLQSSSTTSILISFVVIGIAAFNLALDFDMIERGANAGAPKYMEWYAGFGLMVTVVWLYLEILRLLAKLQDRR